MMYIGELLRAYPIAMETIEREIENVPLKHRETVECIRDNLVALIEGHWGHDD